MRATILRASAAGVLLLSAAGTEATPEPSSRTVRVTGEGFVSVQPDVAVVSVGVDAFAATVAAAVGDATQKMQKILDALGKEGIDSRDIRTTRYEVSVERPWKDGKPGPVAGYRAVNAADVRVRSLARLGTILDRITQAGSNSIGSLQMERDDPTKEQLQALRAAYAFARTKAEALARAAGVELGDLLSISEGSAPMPRPLRQAVASTMASAEVPIAQGELVFRAQVEALFAIR